MDAEIIPNSIGTTVTCYLQWANQGASINKSITQFSNPKVN